MSSDKPIRLDTRLAGGIKRYHTWPTIQNQSVAEHTWNLLRIYFCVATKVDLNIVFHIIFHDVGEHSVGDIPYPVKSENPMLKEQMDTLERVSLMQQLLHWNSFRQVFLTNEDMVLVKQIELVEMAEFGMSEVCLGNSHGFVVADRCLRAVFEREPCNRLIEYVIIRLKLFFEQYTLGVMNLVELDIWWRINEWEELKHVDTGHDNREDQHTRRV